MNIQQRDNLSGLEKTLEGFGALVKEKNTALLAEFYEIIEKIKSEVENISENSRSPIEKRALYVYKQVIQLIGGQELELENVSLGVSGKSIFLSKGAAIVQNEATISVVSLGKEGYLCVESILKHGNNLSIQEAAKPKLRSVVKSLNHKFSVFGVYFGIKDNIFSCSDSPFVDETEECIEPILLHSNILYFGTNGEQSIKLEIYTPIKERNTYKISCKLGKKSYIFSKSEFEFFLSLLQAGDMGSETTYQTSRNLNHTLADSPLELIGASGKGEKIALRSESTHNIKYLQRISESLPDFSQIFLQTRKKQASKNNRTVDNAPSSIEELNDNEKIEARLGAYSFQSISAQGWGRLRKILLEVESGTKKTSFSISPKQKELIVLFLESKEASIKLSPAEYQIFMQVKKILKNNNLDDLFELFEGKRKKGRRKMISQKKPSAAQKKLSQKRYTTSQKSPVGTYSPQARYTSPSKTAAKTEDGRDLLSSENSQISKVTQQTKQAISLPSLKENSDIGKKLLHLFATNPGVFYSLEELSEIFDFSDTGELHTQLLLAKARYNNDFGDSIFQREGKGWFFLPVLADIPDTKEVRLVGPHRTDILYYSEKYGVCISQLGEVIFQDPNIESYISVKNRKISPVSGRNQRKNIDVLRLKFVKFFPGIKVSTTGIRYNP